MYIEVVENINRRKINVRIKRRGEVNVKFRRKGEVNIKVIK